MSSNFDFLSKYWPDLSEIGKTAEMYLYSDSNACIYKLGLLSERIVLEICKFEKLDIPEESNNADRIRCLKSIGVIPKNIDDILFSIRKARNNAVHNGTSSVNFAKALLHMAYTLSNWFMEVYGDWDYKAKEYIEPVDHIDKNSLEERIKTQEEKLNELIGTIESIKTRASESLGTERAIHSTKVSESIKLTENEVSIINKEQVRIDISSVPAINYALQQNNIPAIQNITISNNSNKGLENLEIRIFADTDVILPFSTTIDYIPENKDYEIKNISMTLNAEVLAEITEKIKSRLIVELFKDEERITEESTEITVLAFDEWHGYAYYPELLTSFVTPNHPDLVKIIARAAEFLKEWTGNPSMDAYQTQDPNRVLNQAAAIFSAVKGENIVYSVPPASFEKVGQRVRLCDAVIGQKFGTCLDLTLLYASCLEAVGLHPIMILTKGHIFSGVWLEQLSFPEPVQDDPSVVTKRLAAGVNEIAVIETTCVVNGNTATFDEARAIAEHNLIGTDPVECIIDVHRARISGIMPLPQRVHNTTGWHIEHDSIKDENKVTAPKAIDGIIDVRAGSTEQNIPKLMQWERKLLDLGLRNNLINLRFSKTLVPLFSSSLDDLEDALSSGSDFSVFPRPNDWTISKDTQSFENIHDLGAYVNVIKSEFANKRLRSTLTESELSGVIKSLYRTSKTALEENGANTLYLALGLLRWYENPRSTKPRYAPIVLLPVEIIRKSANKGFAIRLRDDEPQMNITILEKLKQDFGITVNGLDPLPEDEHGVDTRRVFTILRKAVMEQSHWDVLESAYLGIFSFSQFVMWNDLHNRSEDLMKNKVVKSLVDGKLCWKATPMEIGTHVSEDDVLLPMPADAFQLYAIEAACKGESFVLHGPPGTGKSQTITSLIANALSQGKSVLFVAEKMAALEVVQKRLENIGIGPFCLELHSNKSKKKDVLEQLRCATEVTKYTTAEQYAQKSEQIAKLRSDLDSYASQLHSVQPCGYTLYELINEYEKYKTASNIPAFSKEYVESLGKFTLDEHMILLERLIAAANAVNHPHNNPLSCIGITSYSQSLRVELQDKIFAYRNALTEISDVLEDFSDKIGISCALSFSDIEKMYLIAKEFGFWFYFPKSWAKVENLTLYFAELKEMSEHYIKADKLCNILMAAWDEMFLQQSADQLLKEYNEASSKWFLAKKIEINALAKKLAVFSRKEIIKSDLSNAITTLCQYQTELKHANELFEKYGNDLGELYVGKETDWSNVIKLIEAAKMSAEALITITGNEKMRLSFCGDTTLQKAVNSILEKFTAFSEAKNTCYELLKISETTAKSNWIAEQIVICNNILSNADKIKEWISYKAVEAEALNAGLDNVIEAYKNGMPHQDIIPAYRKAVFYALCGIAIDNSSALNSFSGAVFNEKIEQFKRIDTELTELSKKEIYCRLASKVPDFVVAAAHSSELGILQRMIKSGGRGTSIRKLFEDISNLLPRLCPCMLMSPISVAQYLDSKRDAFDIVVFDEASQLPTCKAVGVLARGKDAVIVGDPKQMPPTSFFATNTVDEDNLDVEDLESILDDCLALNMPQTHLLWHYRSHHESLIAFSNNQFYENKLYTFPSVNDRESKVSLVHIDGIFERGKSRNNRAEAEAIISEIKRRCHDPELSKYSIGVVTFNVSQQHLIDDLLSVACETDNELEKWVYESEEPLFIKNLENVQGDERDVILFSIGYGPDQNGKVYMNFGPLNREGGWRRLNVAVSRARSEMVVYSVLKADQINLSRTSSEGVAALKAFLEYAAGNKLAVDKNNSEQYRHGKEEIALTICEILKSKGFSTDMSIGHSGYRIDIGVIDPKNTEKYLLGILLDGNSYETAKTTRDREIAQINVLNGLGWNIMRIWTMDWWDNSQKEIDRIISKIKDLQNGEKDSVNEQDIVKTELCQAVSEKVHFNEPLFAENNDNLTLYEATKLNNQYISADDFVSGLYRTAIIHSVKLVMSGEAPISHGLLTKRVVQSFGIARSGSRIQEYMDSLYSDLNLTFTKQNGEKVYWKSGQIPESYDLIRVTGNGDNKRDTKDVPITEAVNAVSYVLEQQISLSNDDLIREAAKLMGYTRMGNLVVALFEKAIDKAAKQNKIKLGANGKWKL